MTWPRVLVRYPGCHPVPFTNSELFGWFDFRYSCPVVLSEPKDRETAGVIDIYSTGVDVQAGQKIMHGFSRFGVKSDYYI